MIFPEEVLQWLIWFLFNNNLWPDFNSRSKDTTYIPTTFMHYFYLKVLSVHGNNMRPFLCLNIKVAPLIQQHQVQLLTSFVMTQLGSRFEPNTFKKPSGFTTQVKLTVTKVSNRDIQKLTSGLQSFAIHICRA